MKSSRLTPPRVVRTTPAAFADNVPPSLKRIAVTFDRGMTDQSWSWQPEGRDDEMFPEVTGQPFYDRRGRTCTLPVKLRCGKVYWVWINSPIHRYFMSPDCLRAKPQVLLFATRGAGGKPTTVPEHLRIRAEQINSRPEPPQQGERFREHPAKSVAVSRARAAWPPKGRPVMVPVTRDTWLSKLGGDRVGNRPGQKRLKLKGQQDCVLFDADLSALKGRIVTGALWHVHCGSPADPLMRVTVSTVASHWKEITDWERHRAAGGSCYEQAQWPKRDWAYPGSNFMDAAFGRGHTLWRFADATPPDAHGWQRVAVEPAVVAANVAGLSCGFAACDDVGNVWTFKNGTFSFRYFPNRMIHSREDRRFAPYLEVWVDGTDDRPPGAVTGIAVETAGLPAGEAVVTWKTPPDAGGSGTLGFVVDYATDRGRGRVPRYLVPMAGEVGKTVRMHLHDMGFQPGERVELSIAAVDAAGNVGPAVTKRLKVSATPRTFHIGKTPVRPFPPCRERPTVAGLKVAVVDLLDKIHPITGRMVPSHPPGYKGGNHIWSGPRRKVRIQAARNEAVCFNLNLEGKADAIEVDMAFPGQRGLKCRLFRYHYTGTGVGPMPDACLPLDGPLAGNLRPAGAKNISVLCEIYVPHKVRPGRKIGRLRIKAAGQTLDVRVELTVWAFTLPDKLSFVPEMNAYYTVTPTGRALEYYRLAHEHRLCMNRLYYSWDGVPDERPVWLGERFDWRAWDSRFAPLLDGSAFADLPRAREPVDFFYLPLSDNWPINIHRHYRPSYWIEQALAPRYEAGNRKAFADMARHFNRKGWHDTIFQYFQNSKVYYKDRVGWRGSSAPWIFDEPVNTQDFWALRWYGRCFHEAVDPVRGKAKLWFRGDVSYSQHGRNMLWGIMDLECFGGCNDQKIRQKADEQVLWSKSHFTQYGGANHPKEANLQPVVWCLKAWSQGAVGVLPWHTIADEGAWDHAGNTDLFYPHPDGIVPSVRLKAFRRGQQDVEYLTLLCKAHGRPLFAVAGGVREVIDLKSRVHKRSETDAGTISFDQADPTALWELRYRVGRMISAKRPRYRRVVRPMPTPRTDMQNLPDIGYVGVAPKVPSAGPDYEP